jgi:hypothetical protein
MAALGYDPVQTALLRPEEIKSIIANGTTVDKSPVFAGKGGFGGGTELNVQPNTLPLPVRRSEGSLIPSRTRTRPLPS